jgi:citrate/tricarballylate utilization protein
MSSPEETERALRICAACMYCDALCPVFPALADVRDFAPADLHYLAHLCHNCRSCWDACQYAPPHPFAISLPATLAAQRRHTYETHVWPRALAPVFRRPGLGALIFVGATAATMAALIAARGVGNAQFGGAFYAVIPWIALSGLAGSILVGALLSLAISTLRYWRLIAPRASARPLWRAAPKALRDIVTLRHLEGESGRWRRRWHHAMAAGLALDLVSTLSAAALQHVYEKQPPFPLLSLPVIVGAVGGVAVVAGTAGLLALEARPAQEGREAGEAALNVVLLAALALVAASGLLLLALRETAAMAPLMMFHAGVVGGLFGLLPASKLLHAPFRALSLWRAAAESRR